MSNSTSFSQRTQIIPAKSKSTAKSITPQKTAASKTATKSKKKSKQREGKVTKILGKVAWTLVVVALSVLITYGIIESNQIRADICRNDSLEFAHSVVSCGNITIANSEGLDFALQTSENTDPQIINQSFDVAAIYQTAFPSVVGVGVKNGNFTRQDSVIGSGFVISKDGLIATNQHVVSDQGVEYFVRLPETDEIVDVVEVFRDRNNDIAILRVDRSDLQPLTLGDSDALIPGELVIAIGNPLGELDSTVTSGIVSGLKRTVETDAGTFLRSDIQKFEDTIQTDAAINPGNSGGPLLNKNGEVVGINFATIASADNLSFAIPISYLETRLNELAEFGRFRIPYIGIEYTTQSYILNNEIIVGAEINSIDPNGTASGVLLPGDVITEFDGIPMDEQTILSLIQGSNIGDVKSIKVIRGNAFEDLEIVIGERE